MQICLRLIDLRNHATKQQKSLESVQEWCRCSKAEGGATLVTSSRPYTATTYGLQRFIAHEGRSNLLQIDTE